jgi:hypothetical protein
MGKHRNDAAADTMTMPEFIAHLESINYEPRVLATIQATYNAASDTQKALLEIQMRPVLDNIAAELRNQGHNLDTTTSRPTP